MAEITPEELERRLEAGRELLKIEGQLTEQQQNRANIIEASLQRAQQVIDTGNKRLEQLQLERSQLSEKDAEELAMNAKRIEEQKVFAQFARDHQNEIAKVQQGLKNHAQTYREESNKSFTDADKNLNKLQTTGIKKIESISDAAAMIGPGVEAGVSTAAGALSATVADPKMLAIGAMPGVRKAIGDLKTDSISAFSDIDTSLRELTTKQGGYYNELGAVFEATLDPNYAKRMGLSFEGLEDPIHLSLIHI